MYQSCYYFILNWWSFLNPSLLTLSIGIPTSWILQFYLHIIVKTAEILGVYASWSRLHTREISGRSDDTQSKKGETIVTPDKIQMGLTSLVLVSIWIVACPRKACEKALPTTPDSTWSELAIVKHKVLKFCVL